MDGVEKFSYPNIENTTKKWAKKVFGGIRGDLPKAPKNLYKCRSGWRAV